MQHPQVNPSLAPFGFVFPNSRTRLDYEPKANAAWVNAERLIAKLWAEAHRAASKNPLPAYTIIHNILPSQATSARLTTGDFEFQGSPYLSRDIALLSSVVQWFGTNCGSAFLEGYPVMLDEPFRHSQLEFVLKLELEHRRHHFNLVRLLTHTCVPQCHDAGTHIWLGGQHHYRKADVTDRDRAVVDGLMRWLGKHAGRAFVETYLTRLKTARDAAWQNHNASAKAA